ncbi:MAG: cob(I)yrinic acid a,c-diamide adenosyltransferase [Planctomycetes bacterium]|nr:cob(I)yrinic acid a,c-diamide adenosyltransferase [Planctomycetota bacterium]
MAAKTPHGLVIINTGDGKGKTTAALGMAMRAVGHGMRVAFVQFVKAWSVGEHDAAARLGPNLEIFRMGKGFVVGEPAPEHRQAARDALEFVRQCLRSGRYEMVAADEILTAVGLKLLAPQDVEALLPDRPPDVHLVLTGRGAWDSLIEKADLVTEMRLIKHPYDKGVLAQEGVEF